MLDENSKGMMIRDLEEILNAVKNDQVMAIGFQTVRTDGRVTRGASMLPAAQFPFLGLLNTVLFELTRSTHQTMFDNGGGLIQRAMLHQIPPRNI